MEINMTKKHVLALAAAGTMVLGATSLSSAEDIFYNSGGVSPTTAYNEVTPRKAQRAKYRHSRDLRARQDWRAQSDNPLTWPFAAAAGAVGTAGAIVGGAASVLPGYYPYSGYSREAYGSYAYAPGAHDGAYGAQASYPYAPGGVSRDIGHSYYNGFGSQAPASSDNCAVDAGYGRKDYSVAC
jgi:hypothetical protein